MVNSVMKNTPLNSLMLNAMFCILILYAEFFYPYSIFVAITIMTIHIISLCDASFLLMLLDIFGSNSKPMNGKVIWITGASSGIGKACAIRFAELKCRIVLTAPRADELEEVKENCIEAGNLSSDDVLVLPLDITKTDLQEEAFDTVLKHFGQLDILLSNAGVGQLASWENITKEVDIEIYNVNVFGPVNLARVVTKYFLEQKKGQHVVVTSVTGKYGMPFAASYSGVKFALHGIYESLRAQHGAKGIDVTLLVLGPIVSNFDSNRLGATIDEKDICHDRKFSLMKTSRCAHLISVATRNRLSEVYISIQPTLIFVYFATNFTSLLQWILTFGDIFSKSGLVPTEKENKKEL